jgi:hypothetical protein
VEAEDVPEDDAVAVTSVDAVDVPEEVNDVEAVKLTVLEALEVTLSEAELVTDEEAVEKTVVVPVDEPEEVSVSVAELDAVELPDDVCVLLGVLETVEVRVCEPEELPVLDALVTALDVAVEDAVVVAEERTQLVTRPCTYRLIASLRSATVELHDDS